VARKFVTLDVFTHTRFAGNPLAIVLEPDGLEKDAMQRIAREFNLPETVFVFPPKDPANRARLRIFTPANELPFAGHPTVGAAVFLGMGKARSQIVLEEEVGLIACAVETVDAGKGRAQFKLPRLPEKSATAPDAATTARTLGLTEADLADAPSRWSAGLEFTFVPLRGLDAMARAKPQGDFDALIGNGGPGRAFLFCKETAERHDFHARMFAPGMGIPEDPATGSAAAAFAGIAAAGRADGAHALVIEQGYEMKRPSLIELGFTIDKGKLTAATIGGYAVTVSEGAIDA